MEYRFTYDSMDRVHVIQESLYAAQSRQKSYIDQRV